MKWWFILVPGLMKHLKTCADNEMNRINEREQIINAYDKSLRSVQDKHDSLLKDLLRERACVEYYARPESWYYQTDGNTYKGVFIGQADFIWHEEFQRLSGGKLAQETISNRQVKL